MARGKEKMREDGRGALYSRAVVTDMRFIGEVMELRGDVR